MPTTTLDPQHPLDRRLLAFAEAMKAKFVAREAKHPGESSVTHVDFDWARSLDFEAITIHAHEEIQEWKVEGRAERRAGEAIDVANMMFLERQIFLERMAAKARLQPEINFTISREDQATHWSSRDVRNETSLEEIKRMKDL